MSQQRTATTEATREVAGVSKTAGRQAAQSGKRVASRTKEETRQVTAQAAGQARDVASTAAERGQNVVRAAGESAGELADTVKEQAGRVGSELASGGRSLANETKDQLQVQARVQSGKLAETCRKLGEEAQALADGRPDDAPNLTQYVGEAAGRLYDTADRLHTFSNDVEERGIEAVAADMQAFARRRPGAFLLGAAVAGFGFGRLVRSGRSNGSDQQQGTAPPTGARSVGSTRGALPSRTGGARSTGYGYR